jgi:signal transduction histidine kinase/copper chaperone CopZ
MSVIGFTCVNCAVVLGTNVRKLNGVVDANVDIENEKLSVSYDSNVLNEKEIIACVKRIGYDVAIGKIELPVMSMQDKTTDLLIANKSLYEEISEHKLVENSLRKLNRTYALLSEINQAIMRVHKLEELFEIACNITVEKGGFLMAWIGLLDPLTMKVNPVAHSGMVSDYLERLNIKLDDSEHGHGPTATALRTNKHFMTNDIVNDPRMNPWRPDALRLGFRSAASFPLGILDGLRGTLTIYAPESNFFNDEELRLFDDMAANITFAMGFAEQEEKRKQAEDEIRKLNETLEQRVILRTEQFEAANKELEAFSYSISHDLRAPLRHINGFINLFLEHKTTQLTDEEQGYLDVVTHSSDELGKLIDALLSFSRLSRSEIRKSKTDTLQIINQGLKLFDQEIKDRSIEIKIGSLPETYGDFQLIGQVWTNLISNAIKYTGKRAKPIIEIGGFNGNSETIFFIKDNGAGFNMKYVDKLFGVFQRLHKARDFEGTGIGLANINRIITRHGGRCWAEGEVDKGATFFFSLPVESIAK